MWQQTIDDIRNLVTDHSTETFTNFVKSDEEGYDQSGRFYLSRLLEKVRENRSEDQFKFFAEEEIANTGADTRPMQSWKFMTERLEEIVSTQGQITKNDIDLNFFTWLKTWDTAWTKHQEDNLWS